MVTFTRQALYDILWIEPTKTFAQRVGVSDVAVAKVCRGANVPIPPRGYWAQKEERRKPLKMSLPKRFPGASDLVEIAKSKEQRNHSWPPQPPSLIPVPEVPIFPESIEDVAERARKLVRPVQAHRDFTRAFGDIAKLLRHDEERRTSQWSFDRPMYDAGIERRRLLLLLSLFQAVIGLGGSGSLATTSKYAGSREEDRRAYLRIGAQLMPLQLEPIAASAHKGEPQIKEGRLRLTLEGGHLGPEMARTWQDEDSRPLERQLTATVVDLLVAAEHRYRRGVIQHREWVIQRNAAVEEEIRRAAEEKARKARELRVKEVRKRIEGLLRQASELQRADAIRSYVAAIRARVSDFASAETVEGWATWALAEADRIDPAKSDRFLELLPRNSEQTQDVTVYESWPH